MSASARPSARIDARSPSTIWAGSPEAIGPATMTSSTSGMVRASRLAMSALSGAHRSGAGGPAWRTGGGARARAGWRGRTVVRGSGGSHDPCGIAVRAGWRRRVRRARRCGGDACRTERAERRAMPAGRARLSRGASRAVPSRVAEDGRTTGVTATAICYMASSFDGCPRFARTRALQPSPGRRSRATALRTSPARITPARESPASAVPDGWFRRQGGLDERRMPVRQPPRARAGCA